ncbi:MAG TPA: TetR/AcrR family transcriptional regulator [Deltaproteobacteria bacterium]|nr:TetR/AcrR family transcriptional regulator [Deltaproteobacteria bacterium]
MGRREDNKRRKREALLSAGLALFSEQGPQRTSVEQIAAAADVARGTFYLYFDNKLALFGALMDRFSVPVAQALAQVEAALAEADSSDQAREIYHRMTLHLATIGVTHREEILVAFRASRQPGPAGALLRQREQALIDTVVRFTADAAERGLISVRHPRVAALVVYGAVERLVFEILTGAELGEPQALAEEVLALFGSAMGFAASGP